jgi:hypothetical protein
MNSSVVAPPPRLSPLTGIAGVACVVAGLALDRAPTSQWPDAQITQWYSTHGRSLWFVSACLVALGAPLLLAFTAILRDRLDHSGASRLAGGLVSGSGIALAVTYLVGAGVYAAIPAAMTFSKAPAPDPSTSRYFLGASYGILVMFSAFAAALLAVTVSVTAQRTRALPRWLAIAGVPTGALMLLNAVMPMAVITLWFLVVSITMTVRQRSAVVTAPLARAAIPTA